MLFVLQGLIYPPVNSHIFHCLATNPRVDGILGRLYNPPYKGPSREQTTPPPPLLSAISVASDALWWRSRTLIKITALCGRVGPHVPAASSTASTPTA